MAGTQLVIQCGVMGVPNSQSYSLQPEGWFPGELAGLLCNSMRILTSLLLESWRRLHWINSIWPEEFFLKVCGYWRPFWISSKDYMNYKLFSSTQLQAVGDDVKGLLLHTFIVFSESVHDTCVLEKINLYQKAVYSHPDYFYCGGWRLLLHWPACWHHYLVLKAAARNHFNTVPNLTMKVQVSSDQISWTMSLW